MKEKVLYITAYVPHKAAAGEKNTMLMLNDLAERYDVDLIYFKYDYDLPYQPEKPNVKVKRIFRNSKLIKLWGITNMPFIHPVYSIRFSWLKLLIILRIINRNKYKAIILNHSNVFFYGKFMPVRIPKILFAHDVIIQRAKRNSNWLMQSICHFSENMCFKTKNSHIFSFSQKDVDIIKQEYSLPAKVSLDYIDPDISNKEVKSIGDFFMMFGDWTRKENYEGALWFIKNVSPFIKEKTIIKIIGRKFPSERIENNNPLVNYEILGFVDDPYVILSQAKALISPLFNGAGIKVKVIESLACGTPVIGTDIAFEGLPSGFDSFMYLANTVDEYINAMKNVETDISIRNNQKKEFIKCYTQDSINNFINSI